MDKGGVGEKFFEGMINLSYLKKLKKRLHETTEYFQVKGEKDTDNGKNRQGQWRNRKGTGCNKSRRPTRLYLTIHPFV